MTARTLRPLPNLSSSILIVFRIFTRRPYPSLDCRTAVSQQQSLHQPFGTISALEGLLNAEWGSATFPGPRGPPFDTTRRISFALTEMPVFCTGSNRIQSIVWIDFYQSYASLSSTSTFLTGRGKRKQIASPTTINSFAEPQAGPATFKRG